MHEENPGEIDFCSSDPEFRVDEGSSYRESTLHAKRTAEMENTCNPAPNVNKKVGGGGGNGTFENN